MPSLDALLEHALERAPLGEAHARWVDMHGAVQGVESTQQRLHRWLKGARGVVRCELLCAWARLMHTDGHATTPLMNEALALARSEWAECERAWAAVGETHRVMGDSVRALHAWTHPERVYRFEDRAAVTRLAMLLCAQQQWEGLEALLAHVGEGHDQAFVLRCLLGEAQQRHSLRHTLQLLWWIPEPLRETALLQAIKHAVQSNQLAEAWQIEGLWDGLDGGQSSRGRARALLGDAAGGWRLLSPVLVHWLEGTPVPPTVDLHHAVVGLVLLDDVGGACWVLKKFTDARAAVRAVSAAATACDAVEPLLATLHAHWPGHAAVLRGVGLLRCRRGQADAGRALLRAAVAHADQHPSGYARRLGLQEAAHAQILAGDIDAALQTITRLSHPGFGHEHRAAAAIALARQGDTDQAVDVLSGLPPGDLLIDTLCTIRHRSWNHCSVMMSSNPGDWTC